MLLKKIFYTVVLLSAIRIGNFIPIVDINQAYLYESLKGSSILSLLNTFSQGKQFILGIFSLGVLPNINASLLMQLFTSIFPGLKKLQKEEGENGRKKITKYTRYLTTLIAGYYGFLITFFIKPFVFGFNTSKIIEISLVLTTGSIIIMWISELITEFGIGNGSSLIIFINIISSLPDIFKTIVTSNKSYVLLFLVINIVGIIFVQKSIKIVKIFNLKDLNEVSTEDSYSLSKEKDYQYGFIPFKLNQSGIFPIIFATTFLTIPINYLTNFSWTKIIPSSIGNLSYILVYFSTILIFNFFYSGLVINTTELSAELIKMGLVVCDYDTPSKIIRPGIQTEEYFLGITNRLAIIGGLFLAFVATLPILIGYFNPDLSVFKNVGATSLIIFVSVAFDINRQIRSELLSEYYKTII
jgi:preprotein translocase subunit SecY|tara:strand:+ start:921 stop:2156 length:1236 start_codon:yes stop_codon:yes gene_type:complete